MSGLQDQKLRQLLDDETLNRSKHPVYFFFISLFIVFCFASVIYIFQGIETHQFLIWVMSISAILALILFLVSFYTEVKYDQTTLKRSFQMHALCMISGLLMSSNCLIQYIFLHQIENVIVTNLLMLPFGLVVVSQLLALTFLTYNIQYFYSFFVATVIPLFLSQILAIFPSHSFYFLIFYFILIMIFLSAHIIHQIHRKLNLMSKKNQELTASAILQNKWTEELCQQLQKEVNKAKNAEAKLQFNNHLLEQKIRERTHELTQMNEKLREHAENLTFAHETAGIRSWEWNLESHQLLITNTHGQINQRFSAQQFKLLKKLIHPEDIGRIEQSLFRHLCGLTKRYDEIFRIHKKDGEWSWIHDIGQVITRNEDGVPLRMVGIHRDINQEKKDQERSMLCASVLEQASEGIFILDHELNYIEVNPYFEKLTELSKDEIIHKHLLDISVLPKEKLSPLNIEQQLQQFGHYDGEFKARFTSGKVCFIWLHINSVQDEHHNIINYIGIVSDQTERKRQEQRLTYLEYCDPLTGLPNRFYYHQKLRQYLNHSKDVQAHLAIVHINIDRFRSVNEILNNKGADELLKKIAHRLKMLSNQTCFSAHLGGDDFALIYELKANDDDIQSMCISLQSTLQQPFKLQQREYVITTSIGVAIYPEHGMEVETLNSHAEQALFQAKRLGGNTIRLYAPHPSPHFISQSADLEHDLRNAIANNELEVYYQPKICTNTLQVCGFEALIRWQHPTKGLLMPNAFIPLAERTSLISDIGRIVLEQAAQQIQTWASQELHVPIAVNIVAQQIHRGQLLSDIDFILRHYEISGEYIELEITESALLDDTVQVKHILEEIKRRGITIALDDFGTGYSSLAYLTEYPIDVLKIDRAFIARLGSTKQDAIVTAMIAMGKTMGLKIVAEGIETKQQRDFVLQQQCDMMQGYLFAKPMDAEAATHFIKQQQP